MEAGAPESGGSDLERISVRLDQLAEELGADPDEERAAELAAEASKLAAEAGTAVEQALRGESGRPEPS